LGVRYTEYDVSRDETAAEDMVKSTGQMGVPVIMVDGQAVIGFDRGRLQALLAAGAGGGNKLHLGVAIGDASRQARRTGNVPIFGAFIGRVAPGSIGAQVGLQPGDIVTEINQRGVSGAADMEKALAGLKSGDVLAVVFLRGSETRKSEIVI
jgi:membrane-associated protease RseP (regulator of RpoE activity)